MAPSVPFAYVIESGQNPPAIEAAPTSIAAFVGFARTGPTNGPGLVRSFDDFETQYGGLDPGFPLGYAVSQFFANGGAEAYVLRLAPTAAGTGEPSSAAFHEALNADGSRLGADGAPVGVWLLDLADLVNLICVPGETDAATIANLQAYARSRRAFLIVDCKPSDDVASLTAPAFQTSAMFGADAINSAFYFPWVLAPDPVSGGEVAYPPSGFVAGVYAATDASRGVWSAPSGVEASLGGATGLTVGITDSEEAALNAAAVDCLRVFLGQGPVVWGARTQAGSDGSGSEWTYVPVRRLALFLEQSIGRGVQWAVLEPNAEPLWARLRLAVGAFLHAQFAAGAFQGAEPRDAYFVKCGADTTTEADLQAGVVNIVVGFAPLKPAEFVVLTIQTMAEASG